MHAARRCIAVNPACLPRDSAGWGPSKPDQTLADRGISDPQVAWPSLRVRRGDSACCDSPCAA
jgi:hypothetical protein